MTGRRKAGRRAFLTGSAAGAFPAAGAGAKHTVRSGDTSMAAESFRKKLTKRKINQTKGRGRYPARIIQPGS